MVERKSVLAALTYIAMAVGGVVLAVASPKTAPTTIPWALFVLVFAFNGSTLLATLLWLRRTNRRS
ncbi:MAG: hypothetical protein JWL72_3157 [Ilumatobacteraceae bacterium]|nr:hypothetical protein [Ilumatobacteraceae bacterium]